MSENAKVWVLSIDLFDSSEVRVCSSREAALRIFLETIDHSEWAMVLESPGDLDVAGLDEDPAANDPLRVLSVWVGDLAEGSRPGAEVWGDGESTVSILELSIED